MVPESKLEKTEAGLVAPGAGWFVVNARDARWVHREGRGAVLPFTGWWEEEAAEAYFPQFGVNLFVLAPGEPMSMYHGEEAQEDFLVLSGRCVLLIEREERPLAQWDFVHCPAWTEHAIVGAGEGTCVVLAMRAALVTLTIDHDQAPEAANALTNDILPTVCSAPGFVTGYWLEPVDGQGLSFVVFETEQARRSARPASSWAAPGVNINDLDFRRVAATAKVACGLPAPPQHHDGVLRRGPVFENGPRRTKGAGGLSEPLRVGFGRA